MTVTNVARYVQIWIDNNTDWRKFDIVEFCIIHGFYSWNDTIDEDGFLLDSFKIISRWDLQDACNSLGIEFDCINF